MPPSITATPPTPLANGFQPEFFQPYTPTPEPRVPSPGNEGRPKTSYSAERHGSHAKFCAGEHFAQYREEMRENLDFLIARCKQLNMHDASQIEQRFWCFYEHRFAQAYFDTHAELVDSAGKRALDNFCTMLRDERLPEGKQIDALRNLSTGVTLCASGAVANLIAADRELSLSVGGIRCKLWKVKEDVVRNVLQQAMAERFGANEDYPGDEIHYVHAAWNYIADAVGLNRIPDWMAPRLDSGFLNWCQQKVFAALSPEKIANTIAEECLAKFSSWTVSDSAPASGECTGAAAEWFLQVLNDIRCDLGLDENALSLHSFVRLDDAGRRYHVRDDPSLIALELLKAMNANSLLADAPIHLGERVDEDGRRIGLYSYGDSVAWQLGRAVDKDSASLWDSHDDVEVIGAFELGAWRRQPNTMGPPAATIQRVLRNTDPAGLMSVRADLLGTSQSILSLLKRLDHDQALQYLDDNLPYLLTGLPSSERSFFIDEVISMGKPGSALARGWYPGPWALLAEKLREDTMSPMTRLECWLLADDTRAIDAFLGMVSDGWSNRDDPVSLRRAILRALDGIDGRSILWNPVCKGSPNAIGALHRLLVHLLDEPTLHEHVKSLLPVLFSGREYRAISIQYLLGTGKSEGLGALHRMLFDPLILPHITRVLPTILLGDDPDDTYLMWAALSGKDASTIQAYGILLADVADVPGMEKWLPRLMTPNRPSVGWLGGRPHGYPLLGASLEGVTSVIKAYHAVLVHPAILPHIEQMLPELLVGASTSPNSILTQADLMDGLLNKQFPGCNAYHEMITDPLILPHVMKGLPLPLSDKIVQAGIA